MDVSTSPYLIVSVSIPEKSPIHFQRSSSIDLFPFFSTGIK